LSGKIKEVNDLLRFINCNQLFFVGVSILCSLFESP